MVLMLLSALFAHQSFRVTSGGRSFSTGTEINVLGQVKAHTSTAQSGTTRFAYGYNPNGQCKSLKTPEGQWNMDYDSHGFLTSGAGTGLTYSWDAAGRRLGAGNDYMATSRSNGSQVIVMGSTIPQASVTITNGTSVTTVTPSSSGAFVQPYTAAPNSWQSYVVSAVQGSAKADVIRQIFIPPASEVLGNDTSGNRTKSAPWTFGWNALNQLTSAVDNNPDGAMAIAFTYDFQGRMVEKKVTVAGKLKRRTTTLYDGWKPVVQIDYNARNNESARRIYTWGPDMSGSFDGAAGIGGLIEVVEKKPGVTNRCLALNDGMGNVVGLVDEASGDNVATFRSGPFGEVISTYGPRTAACSLHWQTKFYDEDLGLYYFGKRWYDPGTRCFISRDPLREGGGVNLVAYCNNQPLGSCDPIGLYTGFEEGFRTMSVEDEVQASRAAAPYVIGGTVGTAAAILTDGMAAPWIIGIVSSAVGDTAYQGTQLALGQRKGYSPTETAISGAAGGVLAWGVPFVYSGFSSLSKSATTWVGNRYLPWALNRGSAINPLAEITPKVGSAAESAIWRSGGSARIYPRSAGLADTTTIGNLLDTGALPGIEGVTLSQRTIRFGDLQELSTLGGREVEFALTRENGAFRLYSGGPGSVATPSGARVIGHTHPGGTILPSTTDINSLNNAWLRQLSIDPYAPVSPSRVIWGIGNTDNTIFYPSIR
jgi:RHS repeat-associated protein